jgi:glycine betaine transporter
MAESTFDRAMNRIGEADPVVLGLGAILPVLFGIVYAINSSTITRIVRDTNGFLWNNFALGYLGVVFAFVLIVLVFLIGPWRNRKLGDGDPEFGYLTYFAMVFSTGIAAGIVFWGPAEAAFHLQTVPPFIGADPGTNAAGVGALEYTFFHWGFSPWAIYAAVAIPIAHYAYNYDNPLRVSTLLTPIVGEENLSNPLTRLVDVLAVFATLGGLGTTVGLISRQFLGGVQSHFGVGVGDVGVVLLVLSLCAVFTIATVTGLRRGIKRLALLNVAVFAIIGLVTLVLGPTASMLSMGATAFGMYLIDFPAMSLFAGPDWVSIWTVFYWAWWLSWAPFVGLFIARISYGRTIKTVILTTVGASALATMAWFLVMGGAAVNLQLGGVANFTEAGQALAGFVLFGSLPLSQLLIALFLFAIITFLVTSANASTLGLAMLTDYGDSSPSTTMRVFWGVGQGLAASALIVMGGADALQSAAVITGGPIGIIVFVGVVGMLYRVVRHGEGRTEAPAEEPVPGEPADD